MRKRRGRRRRRGGRRSGSGRSQTAGEISLDGRGQHIHRASRHERNTGARTSARRKRRRESSSSRRCAFSVRVGGIGSPSLSEDVGEGKGQRGSVRASSGCCCSFSSSLFCYLSTFCYCVTHSFEV